MPHQAVYTYKLGQGLLLNAFSVDPNIDSKGLADFVSSEDRGARLGLEEISRNIRHAGTAGSFRGLGITMSSRRYQVPNQLQAYRDALGEKLDSIVDGTGKRRYTDGPVAIVDGRVAMPLKLVPGGYYDFMTTKLEAVPADLLPGTYPQGKTVRDLMGEFGINAEERARYIGFAYLMRTDNGRELSFVHRGKKMGIAADIMALSGSTPGFDERFTQEGFDFQGYYSGHVADEMTEEYNLRREEFQIGRLHLVDDTESSPFVAVELTTSVSTRELSERIFGKTDAIKEHPILYSTSPDAAQTLIRRFDMWPSTAWLFDRFA